MFNAGSMPHRLNKANFRLFMVYFAFICSQAVFVKLLAHRIGQVANISNGTRPHVDARERIHQSAFSALCMTK